MCLSRAQHPKGLCSAAAAEVGLTQMSQSLTLASGASRESPWDMYTDTGVQLGFRTIENLHNSSYIYS